jgi:cytidylate kinase
MIIAVDGPAAAGKGTLARRRGGKARRPSPSPGRPTDH